MDNSNFDGIQNAIYYLIKIKNNLKINKINNVTWQGKIDHLKDKLEALCITHNPALNLYHVNQSLILAEETFFHPLIKLTEYFSSKTSSQELIKIGYFLNQLEYIGDYIPVMLNSSLECIFLKPQNDPCWQLINNHLQIEQVDTPENLLNSFNKLKKLVHLGMSYMILGHQKKNIFSRIIKQHYGIAKCMLKPDHATSNALLTFTDPDLSLALKLSRGTENILIQQSIKAVLPQINFHKVLYLPRLFEPLTFQELQKEINQPFKKIFPPKLVQMDIPQNLRRQNSQAIQVRLLSKQNDTVKTTIDQIQLSSIVQNVQLGVPNLAKMLTDSTIKNIVFHIHGGGWISTSSFFHQNYTRKWANFLGDDTLIISIDYRLAPEYTYPYALDDCWQVYLWIVNFASVFLKTNVEKIIITGDSAGGNMALGVTYRAIKQNVRKPDGISLLYPAMNLGLERYTPSNFNCILDTVFPFSMIKLAVMSYINITGVQPDFDPYLSPAIACDEYLQELPNITISCGSLDSQKDEVIKFLYRLLTLKQQGRSSLEVKMKIYNGFPHGYLNFDFPGNPVYQVKTLVEDSAKILQELFQKTI